jgi:hypothetical protein
MSPPAEKARCPDAVMTMRVRIAGPGFEPMPERTHHAVCHSIERLRPIERHDAGGAAAFEEDFGVRAHARRTVIIAVPAWRPPLPALLVWRHGRGCSGLGRRP